MITGEVVVHGKVEQKKCNAAYETESGSLKIWDAISDDAEWATMGDNVVLTKQTHEGNEIIEPDIIASPDEWTRVERKGHFLKHTDPKAVAEMAKRRDDVDADEVNEI